MEEEKGEKNYEKEGVGGRRRAGGGGVGEDE